MTKKKKIAEFNNLDNKKWYDINQIIKYLYKDIEVVFTVRGSIYSCTCDVRDKKKLSRVYDYMVKEQIYEAKIYDMEYYDLNTASYNDGYQLVITVEEPKKRKGEENER